MPKDIHHTFANVSTIQEYAMDDLIQELNRLRGCELNALQSSYERLVSGTKGQELISITGLEHNPKPEIARYHNAVLVAESLKQHGVKTLKLNSGKDMADQVILCAVRGACDEKLVSALSYTRQVLQFPTREAA